MSLAGPIFELAMRASLNLAKAMLKLPLAWAIFLIKPLTLETVFSALLFDSLVYPDFVWGVMSLHDLGGLGSLAELLVPREPGVDVQDH